MSPTMLLSNTGAVRLVGGASGGPRIITATVQVLLNYMIRGVDGLLASLKFLARTQLRQRRCMWRTTTSCQVCRSWQVQRRTRRWSSVDTISPHGGTAWACHSTSP